MTTSSEKTQVPYRLQGLRFWCFDTCSETRNIFSQKPKCTDNVTREMVFGFSLLEQMLSFLLFESNLIKVSTSRWLHLVHTHHRDKAQRDPVLKGINQNSTDLFNGDLDEIKANFTADLLLIKFCKKHNGDASYRPVSEPLLPACR